MKKEIKTQTANFIDNAQELRVIGSNPILPAI